MIVGEQGGECEEKERGLGGEYEGEERELGGESEGKEVERRHAGERAGW